jgi:periplasmic divalent cation tolerance protein
MTDARMIYITAPDPEAALRIGRALVERRLAACANVIPGMRSVYRWKGAVEEAGEAVLLAKTTADRVEDLIRAVKELHPYECPCVVVLPIEGGFAPFLAWIRESVAERGGKG